MLEYPPPWALRGRERLMAVRWPVACRGSLSGALQAVQSARTAQTRATRLEGPWRVDRRVCLGPPSLGVTMGACGWHFSRRCAWEGPDSVVHDGWNACARVGPPLLASWARRPSEPSVARWLVARASRGRFKLSDLPRRLEPERPS